MKADFFKPKIKGDKIIWTIYLILSIVSIIFVFTSIGRVTYRTNGDLTAILLKHIGIICLGIFAAYMASRIRYDNYAKHSTFFYIFFIVVLILTLVLGSFFGKDANRWLVVPIINLNIQPSEIVKYFLVIYVASELKTLQGKIQEKEKFIFLILKIAAVCILVFPENFSTAGIIFLACFMLLYISGARLKHLLKVILIGAVFLAIVFGLYYAGVEIGRVATWISRIFGFHNNDPNEYNQMNSAIMAIATGGLTGRGIGNTIEGRFLSESHNDFIFAIILEEGGIFMCVFLLLAYLVLFYRCIRVSREATGMFGSNLAIGISLVIMIQTLVNMLVATGLIPVTGQTLPFVSYGGSSFLVSSYALGIILNISAANAKAKKEQEQKEENSQIDNINTEEA